jgi:hypothetical protein
MGNVTDIGYVVSENDMRSPVVVILSRLRTGAPHMTSLEDKAQSGDDSDIILASNAAGVYRLQDEELTSHKNIRATDEVPKYGEFLEAVTVRIRNDRDSFYDQDSAWLECPASLAQELIENSVSTGDVFAVSEPTKGPGGKWQFTVLKPDDPQDLL